MRFSIRTLLIAFAFVTLGAVLIVRPVHRRRDFHKRVHATGGQIYFSIACKGVYWRFMSGFMSRLYNRNWGYDPTGISFYGCDTTGEDLAFLASCPSIDSLNFRLCNIQDDFVAKLAAMPNLKSLDLSGTLITDAALDCLETSQLDKLTINATYVSRERVRAFQQATNDQIELSWSPAIPADERATLRKLEKLGHGPGFTDFFNRPSPPRFLYVLEPLITDEDEVDGLRLILDLAHLTHVTFYGIYSADACEVLSGLSTLEYVSLHDAYMDNLDWLAKSPNLERLDWGDSRLTNGDWSCLSQLPRLRHLDLGYVSSFTEADLAYLPAGQPIEFLELGGNITNASVPLLSTFQQLSTLSLHDCEIDATGLSQLQASLADDVKIQINFRPIDTSETSGD